MSVDTDDNSNRAAKSKQSRTTKNGKYTKRHKTSVVEHQNGKPDWRKVREDAVKRKLQRKSQNAQFSVNQDAKRIWEELREATCTGAQRISLVSRLHQMVQESVMTIVRSHDMSRVCETLYELGSGQVRDSIFSEIRGELLSLSRDKYARHLLLAVLKYGPGEHKTAVGQCFRGRVVGSSGHKFSGEVLETYYRDCATPDQRQRILMEFYGCEFYLLSTPTMTLRQLIDKYPEKAVIYLTNLRSNLQLLFDKQMFTGMLSHRVLRQYLEYCPVSDRAEFVSLLRDGLIGMIHTEDGAWIARKCIWWGSVKDRKIIIKSFKTHVLQICSDPHAFAVVIALLSCIDDTVLVKKALIPELLENVISLVETEYGRKVIHFLLSGRDSHFFHPKFLASLSEGDNTDASKKDSNSREKELLDAVAVPLLHTSSLHCLKWIVDDRMCVLLTSVLTTRALPASDDSLRQCLGQLAELVTQPLSPDNGNHVVNKAAAYMQLKKLIKFDSERATAGAPLLSSLILRKISRDQLPHWLSANRTAFLLVLMLETEVESIVESVKELVKPLGNVAASSKGAEVLMKKLKKLK